jgi:ABC-type polysaccharide/polyol phosphate transport system ATPase subunit
MYLRLAFSVAIHIDPRLVLIDEVLAVGDAAFQKKSQDALTGLIKGVVTAIFVSHNMDAIKKICDRTIWLADGKIKTEGEPKKVVEEYLRCSG